MWFCTRYQLFATLLLAFASSAYGASESGLLAIRTVQAPTIDGVANDPVWIEAPATISRDPVAAIDIELRAAYDREHIYLLVRFPDATEDRQHKTLVWDGETGRYSSGPVREDTLVLKWNMEPFPVDLTLTSDDEYLADIWFWKAHRTDPMGYADDKIQRYTRSTAARATQRISQSGGEFYLIRDGDAGDSSYEMITYTDPVGATAPKYRNRRPSGSRADVRAKGTWTDGAWAVEFRRRLATGHSDDIQFSTEGQYEFGVSRHEIAGRDIDPASGLPMYGAGEIGELIDLHFE